MWVAGCVCVLWVGCEGRRLGRGESVALHDVLAQVLIIPPLLVTIVAVIPVTLREVLLLQVRPAVLGDLGQGLGGGAPRASRLGRPL